MFRFLRGRPGRLTPAEAHARTSASDAVLLDVREKSEWQAGHAPSAVHLPLGSLLAGASLPGAAQGRPVVAICRGGHRSRQAVKVLAGRGVDVVDVSGGMTAWWQAGLPVVDERGMPGTVA
ncbi:rhodanese-like domain-containing protein [Streptomyces sp. NBC_00996]|uniref:rhodanese-like domain-containing protein n=1 Tax=Streptomyces sp. NBC_00996 TaxID=2903710 RepID=UPI0038634B6A|nr:rhodanese-like domain-containing protein [Streptomyces sp. NBC_00996]